MVGDRDTADLARELRSRRFRGVDIAADLERFVRFTPKLIFDVGASRGESLLRFRRQWPDAQIYSFEPATESFDALERVAAGTSTRCFRLAFSDVPGVSTLFHRRDATLSSLVAAGDGPMAYTSSEDVDIDTIDHFCAYHTISSIDYLKIDAEGSDLAILRGTERLLSDQRVAVVELETGMNPTNRWHVPLTEALEALYSRSYLLFGIYEQVGEWTLNQPQLRRANCVFLSSTLAAS